MRKSKRKIDKRMIIIIIIGLAVIALIAAGAILLILNSKATPQEQPQTDASTAVETTAAASTAAASTAQDTTEQSTGEATTEAIQTEAPTAALPESLAALLEKAGSGAETLDALQTAQLVVVDSSGTSANLSFYQKNGDLWERDDSLSASGFVGREGTVTQMSEQVSGTPKGFHPIGTAFYQYDAPATGLESFQITGDTYWVDDPDSRYYNQRVEGTAEQDWSSAEHMASIPGYKYGFVINYNMPAEYNKGSAVFFHIGYNPTAGCVAASEDTVLAYLAHLNAAANPYILVI